MTMEADIKLLQKTTEYNWDSIQALSRLSGLDIDHAGELLSFLVDHDNGIYDWLLSENFILKEKPKRLAIDSYRVV